MAQSVACPLPKPPKGRENSKKVWFFPYKSKIAPPTGLAYAAVRSDSVTLIQIIDFIAYFVTSFFDFQ